MKLSFFVILLFSIILILIIPTIPVLANSPSISTSIDVFSLIVTALGLIVTLVSALAAVAFAFYKQLEGLRKEFNLELNNLKIELESDIREKINVHRLLQNTEGDNYKKALREIEVSLDKLWTRYENRGKRYTNFSRLIGRKIEELLLAYDYIKEVIEEDRQDLKDVFGKLGMAKHAHSKLKRVQDFGKEVKDFEDTLEITVEGER